MAYGYGRSALGFRALRHPSRGIAAWVGLRGSASSTTAASALCCLRKCRSRNFASAFGTLEEGRYAYASTGRVCVHLCRSICLSMIDEDTHTHTHTYIYIYICRILLMSASIYLHTHTHTRAHARSRWHIPNIYICQLSQRMPTRSDGPTPRGRACQLRQQQTGYAR